MDSGYTRQVRERILAAKDGTVFAASDFADIANAAAVRQSLKRLTQDGLLRRVLRGIYEKPQYSRLLKEYVAPDPDAVAKALARSYHWTIAPCGDAALNLLGLSAQVPAVWSYVSDGPYRTYEWDSGKIVLKHRTNREITGLSGTTALVIQALKALGRENVTPKIRNRLSARLSAPDRAALLKEGRESTDWVYEVIRRICAEEKAQGIGAESGENPARNP